MLDCYCCAMIFPIEGNTTEKHEEEVGDGIPLRWIRVRCPNCLVSMPVFFSRGDENGSTKTTINV
jgi:hypothetical protein